MSPSFQPPDFKHMQFPTKMFVDYIRIYQRRGIKEGVTCNPSNRPTSDYISKYVSLLYWDIPFYIIFLGTLMRIWMLTSRHGNELARHFPVTDYTTVVYDSSFSPTHLTTCDICTTAMHDVIKLSSSKICITIISDVLCSLNHLHVLHVYWHFSILIP